MLLALLIPTSTLGINVDVSGVTQQGENLLLEAVAPGAGGFAVQVDCTAYDAAGRPVGTGQSLLDPSGDASYGVIQIPLTGEADDFACIGEIHENSEDEGERDESQGTGEELDCLQFAHLGIFDLTECQEDDTLMDVRNMLPSKEEVQEGCSKQWPEKNALWEVCYGQQMEEAQHLNNYIKIYEGHSEHAKWIRSCVTRWRDGLDDWDYQIPVGCVEEQIPLTEMVEPDFIDEEAAGYTCEIRCTQGKACGDGCIHIGEHCDKPRGKACNVGQSGE